MVLFVNLERGEGEGLPANEEDRVYRTEDRISKISSLGALLAVSIPLYTPGALAKTCF